MLKNKKVKKQKYYSDKMHNIYNNMIQSFDTKQTYMLIHSQTQHALQAPIQENYNRSSLELGPPNENNPKQMWIVEDKGNYRYELILGYVDKVLTCDGDGVTLKRGTGDKSNQYWLIDASIANKVKISKGKDTKKFLGLDQFRIVIRNNPPFELIDCWEFRKVTQNIDLNQSSFLKCMRTNKVMDVPESTSKQGVQICVWEPNYRFNQRWRIYRAGEVYIIKSFKTDLNLDITGEEYVDGNKLMQWHSTGGQNQFWRFQRKNKDTYRICSWVDTSLQIGHHNNKLIISKSQKFTWRVEGAFPEM